MQTQIALLRGVNVGANPLPMAKLKACCEGLKWVSVQTYLQSGNVVYRAADSPAICRDALEKALSGATRLSTTVIAFSLAQWSAVITKSPFLKSADAEPTKFHVTFLAEKPGAQVIRTLKQAPCNGDEWHLSGSVIYLHCPNGYGRSKLSNNHLERLLGVTATTRNWNTVQKLYELAGGL